MGKAECEASGGKWLGGRCVSQEEYACVMAGGSYADGRCISREEIACVKNCGVWENGACKPSIEAFDCTGSITDPTPGLFAVSWGKLPEGTKTVNVHYRVNDKYNRVYRDIKADCETPIPVAGQKAGSTIEWYIVAYDAWKRKTGYSNTVSTVTKS